MLEKARLNPVSYKYVCCQVTVNILVPSINEFGSIPLMNSIDFQSSLQNILFFFHTLLGIYFCYINRFVIL